jgi:hypothetical protein
MLQRIQTIFLIIVALLIGSLFFTNSPKFNIWTKYDEKTGDGVVMSCYSLQKFHYDVNTKVVTEGESQLVLPFTILLVIAFVLNGYTIFRYDNRVLQVKLSLLNSFFLVALLAAMWYYTQIGELMQKVPVKGALGLGFFIPAFSILMNMTANRFIRRDEKVVRDSDRIR